MKFTDLDFGLGKASFAGPVKVFQEPNHDPAYFYFQVKNNQGEDGIMLPMCLPTSVMERFIKELYSILGDHLESIPTSKLIQSSL
jgi:hypothetical protein